MRRLLFISFSVMYALVVIGTTVSIHYCGTVATSRELLPFNSSSGKCGCGEEDADGCCRTELRSVQLNDLHVAASSWSPGGLQPLSLSVVAEPVTLAPISTSLRLDDNSESPPGSLPLHLLNRTLLI